MKCVCVCVLAAANQCIILRVIKRPHAAASLLNSPLQTVTVPNKCKQLWHSSRQANVDFAMLNMQARCRWIASAIDDNSMNGGQTQTQTFSCGSERWTNILTPSDDRRSKLSHIIIWRELNHFLNTQVSVLMASWMFSLFVKISTTIFKKLACLSVRQNH